MKKALWILGLLAITMSCDESDTPSLNKKSVKFSIGKLSAPDSGRPKEESVPSSILLSVVDANGAAVVSQHSLDLIAFGEGWITAELELTFGTYQLTEFIVLDDAQNALAAAPAENSEYAHLVSAPLPIEFQITENPNEVNVEVVAIAEDDVPEDFGYSSFLFSIVTAKRLAITTSIASSTFDPLDPINYSLSVIAKDEDGNQVWSHLWSDLSNAAEIVIPIGYERYAVVVSKAGHIQHAHYYKGTQLQQVSEMRFELIPENTTEILKFNNLDGVGINYYLAADPCLLYARVDFPETMLDDVMENGYVTNDRYVSDGAGIPLADSPSTEVFYDYQKGVNTMINLWSDHTPFSQVSGSDNFCSSIPASAEDVMFQANVFISTPNQVVLHFHQW